MEEKTSTGFRAGFIPLTGLPNAGKSTLMNLLCATRISIISDKPQTTRNNVTGILNAKKFQAVFVDTPGFLKPRNKFEKAMENIMPVLEVKARRVGGATYQVPIEVRAERRQTLGLRWLVNYARLRSGHTMAQNLADEIIDASNQASLYLVQ